MIMNCHAENSFWNICVNIFNVYVYIIICDIYKKTQEKVMGEWGKQVEGTGLEVRCFWIYFILFTYICIYIYLYI